MDNQFMYRLFGLFVTLSIVGSVFITPAAAQLSSGTTLSRDFNPAIGVNILFLGAYTDQSEVPISSGFYLQEAELGLSASIDPFFSGKLNISIHDDNFEIEEGYAQTNGLPGGFDFQIGKFRMPIGKQNEVHTHALPFINLPWVIQSLLGEDGLDETGVAVHWLTPLNWYSSLTAVIFKPGEESVFQSASPGEMVGLVKLKNLFDVTESTTFELGFSWVGGRTKASALHTLAFSDSSSPDQNHSYMDGETGEHAFLEVAAFDATFKHVSPKYSSWDISLEYLQGLGYNDQNSLVRQKGGVTAYGRFQVSRRCWVQLGGDLLGVPYVVRDEPSYHEDTELRPGDHPWRASGLIAWVLSEFSALRLEYDHFDRLTSSPENRLLLQLNVTIGAHPAHSY